MSHYIHNSWLLYLHCFFFSNEKPVRESWYLSFMFSARVVKYLFLWACWVTKTKFKFARIHSWLILETIMGTKETLQGRVLSSFDWSFDIILHFMPCTNEWLYTNPFLPNLFRRKQLGGSNLFCVEMNLYWDI